MLSCLLELLSKIAGSYCKCISLTLKLFFPKGLYRLTFPSATAEGSSRSTFVSAFSIIGILYCGHFSEHVRASHCDFNLCFPEDRWSWPSSRVLICRLCVFASGMSVNMFPSLNYSVCPQWVLRKLYISWIQILYKIHIYALQIFPLRLQVVSSLS